MAKIHEEIIVIKISRLIKGDKDIPDVAANEELLNALEQVAQELVGETVVVEVERA